MGAKRSIVRSWNGRGFWETSIASIDDDRRSGRSRRGD
jgi:hypothetical protein